nr:hypothetical protein [Methyloceanibacter methanicus]
MIRSRSTFATMEAAAIDSDRSSPPTTGQAVPGKRFGTALPSISAAACGTSKARNAMRMPHSVACRILSRSMRATWPITIETRAVAMISS